MVPVTERGSRPPLSIQAEVEGDVPSRGVSHLPEQAEVHVLSVPLRTAEWEQYR